MGVIEYITILESISVTGGKSTRQRGRKEREQLFSEIDSYWEKWAKETK